LNNVISLSGGIGNQLFQLAFARSKAIQSNQKTIVTSVIHSNSARREVLPWLKNDNPWFVTLNLNSEMKMKKTLGPLKILRNRKNSFVSLRFTDESKLILPHHIENYRQFVYEFLIAREGFYEGTFASPLYWNVEDVNSIFRWIKGEILSHLEYPNLPEKFGIAIHARRGDYVLNPKTRNFHGYCGSNYFQTALKVLSELGFAKQGIIISSDDSQFALELKQIAQKYTSRLVVVDSLNPYMAMLQLSNSESFIGSNSTFSFWAAYLTTKESKVFPSKWFRNSIAQFDSKNLLLDNPLLLEIPLES
jgi:hypothetical protein